MPIQNAIPTGTPMNIKTSEIATMINALMCFSLSAGWKQLLVFFIQLDAVLNQSNHHQVKAYPDGAVDHILGDTRGNILGAVFE